MVKPSLPYWSVAIKLGRHFRIVCVQAKDAAAAALAASARYGAPVCSVNPA